MPTTQQTIPPQPAPRATWNDSVRVGQWDWLLLPKDIVAGYQRLARQELKVVTK